MLLPQCHYYVIDAASQPCCHRYQSLRHKPQYHAADITSILNCLSPMSPSLLLSLSLLAIRHNNIDCHARCQPLIFHTIRHITNISSLISLSFWLFHTLPLSLLHHRFNNGLPILPPFRHFFITIFITPSRYWWLLLLLFIYWAIAIIISHYAQATSLRLVKSSSEVDWHQ